MPGYAVDIPSQQVRRKLEAYRCISHLAVIEELGQWILLRMPVELSFRPRNQLWFDSMADNYFILAEKIFDSISRSTNQRKSISPAL